MAPDVPVLGVRPVVPAEKVVTPLLMEEVATHVGTPPLIPRTYPLVPAAIEPKVLMPEKYGMAFGYFSSFISDLKLTGNRCDRTKNLK